MEDEKLVYDQKKPQESKKKRLVKTLLLVILICIPILGLSIGTELVTKDSLEKHSDDVSTEEPAMQHQDNYMNDHDSNVLENEVEPPPTPYPQEEYSGWREFNNEKYGFSFKYPASAFTFGQDLDFIDEFPSVSEDFRSVSFISGPGSAIGFHVEDNPKSLSPVEYWKQSLPNDAECISIGRGGTGESFCYRTIVDEEASTSFTETYELDFYTQINDNYQKVYAYDHMVYGWWEPIYIVPLDDHHMIEIRGNVGGVTKQMIESMTFLE